MSATTSSLAAGGGQAHRRRLRAADDDSASCSSSPQLQTNVPPPQTPQRPTTLTSSFGSTRADPYAWLRDDTRTNPEVLAHLAAENDYTEQVMAGAQDLQDELFDEMEARVPPRYISVPQRRGRHWYYTYRPPGEQYLVHARRRVAAGAGPPSEGDVMDEALPEQVVLDENAEPHPTHFYDLGPFEVSPDERLLAWGVDTVGDEAYALQVREIATGRTLLAEPVPGVSSARWANDNQTLFYVTLEEPGHRAAQLWRLALGASPVAVWREEDAAFELSLARSASERYLLASSSAEATRAVRVLPADQPTADWVTVAGRVAEAEYSVSHWGSLFFIAAWDPDHLNGRLLVSHVDSPTDTTVLLEHRQDVQIEEVLAFEDHLVLLERRQGAVTPAIYALPPAAAATTRLVLPEPRTLAFEEESYELHAGSQGDFDSHVLRLHYTSLITPDSTNDVNMVTGNQVVKKVDEVIGYDKTLYRAERRWVVGAGGAAVPLSLVYRPGAAALDGSAPLVLEAYGAYGSPHDASFSGARLSLLDRGFVYALAHVRGGGDLGRYWYEQGRLANKMNTFRDVLACAQFLVQAKYTSPDRLCLWGRSAGGLTMGAVITMQPELFKAALLDVPFVDILTTMQDENLPLTVKERQEWGDPLHDPAAYDYIAAYSPMDNVRPGPYPHLLLTAGLNDPRVNYWEPAKFVARVRQANTRPGQLALLKVNMGAGHFADSGYLDRLREMALKYAFLLATVACPQPPAAPRSRARPLCVPCLIAFWSVMGGCAAAALALVLWPRLREATGRGLPSWLRRLRRLAPMRSGHYAPLTPPHSASPSPAGAPTPPAVQLQPVWSDLRS